MIALRAILLATAIAVAFGCVAAAAGATTGPPALKPTAGSGAFPVTVTSSGGSSKFYIPGAETTCSGETGTGEFTSAKEGKLTIKLTGCKLGGKQCGNAGEGEIELKPLSSLLGYTDPAQFSSEGRETGLVLSPASGEVFAEFTCTFLKLKVALKGSLIAKVSPLDTATSTLALTIARNELGHQVPSEYENQVGEQISASLQASVSGGAFKAVSIEGPATTVTLNKQSTVAARPYGPPTAVTRPSFNNYSSVGGVYGEVSPEGVETTYHFEYGSTTSYGSVTPVVSAGEGMNPSAVSANISGLTIGGTYHYRVVATSAEGTSYGSDMAFTVRTDALPALRSTLYFHIRKGFTATGGSSTLALIGAEVKCTGLTGAGEFVNEKEGQLTIKLTGCKLAGKQCGNGGEGEIAFKPLRSALEYTYPAKSGSEGRETGLVLYPTSGEVVAEYVCTWTNLKVTLRGSVIAGVSPLGKSTGSLALAITQKEGAQGISEYETELGGAVAASLEGRIGTGAFKSMGFEASALSVALTEEEQIIIKV